MILHFGEALIGGQEVAIQGLSKDSE
jgi:hypothetical protein